MIEHGTAAGLLEKWGEPSSNRHCCCRCGPKYGGLHIPGRSEGFSKRAGLYPGPWLGCEPAAGRLLSAATLRVAERWHRLHRGSTADSFGASHPSGLMPEVNRAEHSTALRQERSVGEGASGSESRARMTPKRPSANELVAPAQRPARSELLLSNLSKRLVLSSVDQIEAAIEGQRRDGARAPGPSDHCSVDIRDTGHAVASEESVYRGQGPRQFLSEAVHLWRPASRSSSTTSILVLNLAGQKPPPLALISFLRVISDSTTITTSYA